MHTILVLYIVQCTFALLVTFCRSSLASPILSLACIAVHHVQPWLSTILVCHAFSLVYYLVICITARHFAGRIRKSTGPDQVRVVSCSVFCCIATFVLLSSFDFAFRTSCVPVLCELNQGGLLPSTLRQLLSVD